MALLGKVDALADDVVTAILNLGDPAIIHHHTITHCHGVRAPNAFDAEVTLHLTIKQLAIVHKDGVPTACILND